MKNPKRVKAISEDLGTADTFYQIFMLLNSSDEYNRMGSILWEMVFMVF